MMFGHARFCILFPHMWASIRAKAALTLPPHAMLSVRSVPRHASWRTGGKVLGRHDRDLVPGRNNRIERPMLGRIRRIACGVLHQPLPVAYYVRTLPPLTRCVRGRALVVACGRCGRQAVEDLRPARVCCCFLAPRRQARTFVALVVKRLVHAPPTTSSS